MKKFICLLFVLVFAFSALNMTVVAADDVMPLNNNSIFIDMQFVITTDGKAFVWLQYEGYENITTGATITIKIEKRNLLVFWKDIVEETITVSGANYSNELQYQLDKTGTYRCTVTYTISGTGGADDVITFQDTATY